MEQVTDDRAAVEKEIAGRTLVTELERIVATHGGEPSWSDRRGPDGAQRTLTWTQTREQALDAAAGLIARGFAAGDRLAVMATNRIEHVLADIAAVHAGGVPLSVYLTLAPAQIAHVARTARPTVVVLEGPAQQAQWAQALAEFDTTVVLLDSPDSAALTWDRLVAEGAAHRAAHAAECEQRARAVRAEDPLTILFTSGTTGAPKGVVLTHTNVLYEVVTATRLAGLEEPTVGVGYLPFAHIAERVLGIYIPQIHGGQVHLVADPAQLAPTLREVRPTRFFGVPRVWEKLRTGVMAMLAAEPDADRRAAVGAALAVGLRHVESLQTGHEPDPDPEDFARADAGVLHHVRAALGFDRVRWASSGAAPMPVEVARFFGGIGMPIFDVYGMTETTGSVTVNSAAGFRLGSAGRALPGMEVRTADDGEILVRGPLVTPGYLGDGTTTAAFADDDGWARTGDIGRVDDDGFVFVVDRKKEMIVTSSGKNIAPSGIENLLKESPLVGHALVSGDGRPYLVAIITLDGETAPVIARRAGVLAEGEEVDLAALAADPRIVGLVDEVVQAANARVSRPEQVKRFHLLAGEWTATSDELTPTLKLRRRVVHTKYRDVLDGLYAD